MFGDMIKARWPLVVGLVLTALWLGISARYIAFEIGWDNISFMLPHEKAAFLAGVGVPVVFLWLFLAYLARGRDLIQHTAMLEQQLRQLSYPSEDAVRRVDSAGTALRRQADLLRGASEEGWQLLAAIETRFREQAEALKHAADETRDEMAKAGESLAQQLGQARETARKLESERNDWQSLLERYRQDIGAAAGQSAEQIARDLARHTETIEAAARRALDQGQAVANDLRQREETLTAASGEATARFQRAIAELGDRMAAAGAAAERVAQDGVASVSQALAQQESRLTEAARAADEGLAAATDRIGERLGALGGELDGGTERLLGKLGEQTGALDRAIEAAAEKMRAKLETERGSLTATYRNMAEEAEARIQAARGESEAILAATAKAVETGAAFDKLLAERGQKLKAALQAGREATAEAGRQIEALADKAGAGLSARFGEHLTSLRALAAETSGQAEEIEARLKAQADAIRQAAATAASDTQGLGTALQTQAEEVSSAAKRIADDGAAALAGLQRDFETLGGRLRRETAELLQTIAEGTRVTIDGLKLQANETGQILQREAGALIQRVREDGGALSDNWRLAAGEAQKLREAMEAQLTRLNDAQSGTGDKLQEALGQITQQLERFGANGAALQAQIDGLIVAERAQADRLGETASASIGKLEAAGQVFVDQAAKLAVIAGSAQSAQSQAKSSLDQLAVTFEQLVQAGTTRLDQLQTAVGGLKGELETAGSFAAAQSKQIGESFRTDTEHLVGLARKAAVQVAAVKGVVKDQLTELGQLSTQVAQLVQIVRDNLRGQAEEIARAAGSARQETATIREEMEQQGAALAQTADQVAARLLDMGNSVDGRAEQLINAADYAVRRAAEIGAAFGDKATLLTDTVDKVSLQVGQLSERFQQHTETLMQSSASAAERLDLLQQKDMAEHREQFMQSANAMVDELNRIALDIHGLFESDVPDDIWKGYNKGDRSIFARRLFRTRDAYLVPAIEQRYGSDARFRDLVGRYLERFEAMLTAVQPVDPDQVLTSAFLTADVGKLYLVLSRSLGRETEH